MVANPNDEIRERMLRYFHERNATATSERGKRGSHVKISDIKAELKAKHGLTQQQVVANLTYLIDSHWVERIEVERSYRAPGGTQQPSTVTWYKITNQGIDLVEGGSSAFKRTDAFAGINVTAVGSTVQVGDGNVVNAKFVNARQDLDELEEVLRQSDAIDDAEKLSAIADIETVKSQLAKPQPDRSIVRQAWSGIEKIATTAGLAAHVLTIAGKLTGLL